MSTIFVYDESAPPPPKVSGLIGATRFGDVVFRRRRLQDATRALVQAAGLNQFIIHTDPQERSRTRELVKRSGADRIICFPAYLPPVSEPQAIDRLQRFLLSPGPCRGVLGDVATSAVALGAEPYLQQLDGEVGSGPARVPVQLEGAFLDIREPDALVDYLSGAFTSRHFNRVARENGVVVKASSDIDKIRREHDYYSLLPPAMRRWFVMPYELRVERDLASYKMERLLALDVGQQWVNGALSVADFGLFLEDVFRFIDERETRPAPAAQERDQFRGLYVDKVVQRWDALRKLPLYAELKGLFDHASGWTTEQLLETYLTLARREPLSGRGLSIVHGDLCLSNILYDKRLRLLKLIDPRGAASESEIFSDPLYDIAKLSHSVLGAYDFVVNGLYDLIVDEQLKLRVFTPESNFQGYADVFVGQLQQRGLSVAAVRLAEASLFLSMLPLHRDAPRNMLAFLLIAKSIVEELMHERAA